MQKSKVLLPVVSEKSLKRTHDGVYTFEVSPKLNKHEIKQLVTSVYRVHPVHLRTITVAGKVKSTRGRIGRQKSRKKVLIALKRGEKIEGFIIETPKKSKEKNEKRA